MLYTFSPASVDSDGVIWVGTKNAISYNPTTTAITRDRIPDKAGGALALMFGKVEFQSANDVVSYLKRAIDAREVLKGSIVKELSSQYKMFTGLIASINELIAEARTLPGCWEALDVKKDADTPYTVEQHNAFRVFNHTLALNVAMLSLFVVEIELFLLGIPFDKNKEYEMLHNSVNLLKLLADDKCNLIAYASSK
jgi:hypothetical protein